MYSNDHRPLRVVPAELYTGKGTSNMQHVDLAALDGKQNAIATDYHLANFFRELFIFRGNRKGFRYHS